MYKDLANKTAVVTGSSSGLGEEIVRRFHEEGMNVIINYHSEKNKPYAEEMAREFNEEKLTAVAVQADVSTEEGIRCLLQAALENFQELDIWVNNAGMEIRNPTHQVSLEEWNQQIGINLTGVFLGSRDAIAYFLEKEKRGCIINMSSVHEKVPWPTFAAYTASKAGVKGFTETIALEYASQGIRVNSIAPGAIETPINAEKFADDDAREQTESMIPLDFIGETKHVASCAAWLASNESEYVTGITLFVDGGMKLYPSFEEGDG